MFTSNELASGVRCTEGVDTGSTEFRFLFRYELAVEVAGLGNSYGGGGGLNPVGRGLGGYVLFWWRAAAVTFATADAAGFCNAFCDCSWDCCCCCCACCVCCCCCCCCWGVCCGGCCWDCCWGVEVLLLAVVVLVWLTGFSTCWTHEGLYTQFGGSVTGLMLWLGRFVSGAYLLDPTILHIVGGLNT